MWKNILASLPQIFHNGGLSRISWACFNFNLFIVCTSYCKRKKTMVNLNEIIIARHHTPTWWVACDFSHVYSLWISWRGMRLSHTLVFHMPKPGRQFTFYHSVPSNSWYSFYRPWKDERLSWPWSHPMVLKTEPQNWESSTLATRPLFHKTQLVSFDWSNDNSSIDVKMNGSDGLLPLQVFFEDFA